MDRRPRLDLLALYPRRSETWLRAAHHRRHTDIAIDAHQALPGRGPSVALLSPASIRGVRAQHSLLSQAPYPGADPFALACVLRVTDGPSESIVQLAGVRLALTYRVR